MADTYNITVTVSNLKGATGDTGLQGPQGIPGEVQTADLNAALALKANLASPTLTGTPAAPTAATATNTTQIATTAFVRANRTELEAVDALKAPIASPTFTGTPAAPTASVATNTTQIATTAFVRTNRAELEAVDTLKAPLASPTFTGTPAAPTPPVATNTTQIATTAYVQANRAELQAAIDLKAPISNPTFTGNVVVPTADAPTEAVNKLQMETAIAAADAANFTVISPNPPETNKPGRVWLKTPQFHAAINASGDNFAPLWPPTDNRAVESKAAVKLLKEAVGWWDAGYSVPGEQYAVNRGTGGSALDARYGSAAGVDSSDPLLLPHTGENYVYIETPPHPAGPLFAPYQADFHAPGNFSFTAKFQLPDSGVTYGIGGRQNGTIGVFNLNLNSDRTLGLELDDGTGSTGANSTVSLSSVGYSLGGILWVKMTFRSSDRRVQFFYAENSLNEPTLWTNLGADVTHSKSGQQATSAVGIVLGARYGAQNVLKTALFRAIYHNDTAKVFDFNAATDITSSGATSFTATTGQTVTVNRATTGRKTALVTRPVWLFGTDDYMEVPDNALLDFGVNDDFTVLAIFRSWDPGLGSTNFAAVSKGNGAMNANGWVLAQQGTIRNIYAGIRDTTLTQSVGGAPAFGALSLALMLVDRTADTLKAGHNNTITAGSAILSTEAFSNSLNLRIGSYSDSPQSNGEIIAAAVFRRVLTTNEILLINQFYGTV
jgi:hypothetical protein